ncbi:hypothetical protein [Candidatus Enterovibrio escicola]|uniref:hypothetical protein n=1 Tax=Candidatus Enterovibrio escicola TaxID=1927127 RepID=UPI001237BD83|nr:hypothetical protein [Candidatus Enterovibrio escacola]
MPRFYDGSSMLVFIASLSVMHASVRAILIYTPVLVCIEVLLGRGDKSSTVVDFLIKEYLYLTFDLLVNGHYFPNILTNLNSYDQIIMELS